MKDILNRFKEPSTWAALAVLASGTPLAQPLAEFAAQGPTLAAGAMAIAAIFLKEKTAKE